MGDRQGSELQREKAPIPHAGLLLTMASAAVFPFDRVLAGMVDADLGIEAICLYLGLIPAVLLGLVVRLGLATPHDRPMRKPGARCWSVLDTMRLIAWRVAAVHPETIGARLGRSANAVRAKARRLRLPVPDRKALRKLDPGILENPLPGFGFADPANASRSDAATESPASLCGRAAGQASIGGSLGRTEVLPPCEPEPNRESEKTPLPLPRRARPADGQHELQLFRVVRNSEPVPAPVPILEPAAGSPAARAGRDVCRASPGARRECRFR